MEFNRKKLNIKPIDNRIHDLDINVIKPLKGVKSYIETFRDIGIRIIISKEKRSETILMMGAHVIRAGVQNYLIDLMERGYISCLAMNGACMIHDFEFALIGATTESVTQYIKNGQFGLWKETGLINDIINQTYRTNDDAGMGETVGKAIWGGNFPYKNISLLASAYRVGVPATIHVGIGYDIIHELPNCDGAATGAMSYNDFLKYVSIVCNLENGVIMNFGCAVMAPEVFLKALSMARNIARQEGRVINNFTTLVCDLHDLPDNIKREPSKDDAFYYFRPFKTMLVRTVADGGESFYVRGGHEDTIPALWSAIKREETGLNS